MVEGLQVTDHDRGLVEGLQVSDHHWGQKPSFLASGLALHRQARQGVAEQGQPKRQIMLVAACWALFGDGGSGVGRSA